MGPLTYKVSNLYFSIRCGTYNSHLYTTLPLKCESIYSSCSPFKRKLLLVCIVVAAFSAADQHKELVPLLLVSPQQTGCLGRNLRRIGTLIPLLGHEGSSGDRPHRGQNNHTSERDTTCELICRIHIFE